MNEEKSMEAIVFMTNSDLINNMKNLGINISSALIPNDKLICKNGRL